MVNKYATLEIGNKCIWHLGLTFCIIKVNILLGRKGPIMYTVWFNWRLMSSELYSVCCIFLIRLEGFVLHTSMLLPFAFLDYISGWFEGRSFSSLLAEYFQHFSLRFLGWGMYLYFPLNWYPRYYVFSEQTPSMWSDLVIFIKHHCCMTPNPRRIDWPISKAITFVFNDSLPQCLPVWFHHVSVMWMKSM